MEAALNADPQTGRYRLKPYPAGLTMIGVLKALFSIGAVRLLVVLAVLIVGAVAAVMIGNRYGDFWGAFVGIFVLPLLLTQWMRRAGIGTPRSKRRGPD